MQSYRDPLHQQQSRVTAPPATLTMSLNGVPGYPVPGGVMPAASIHGYLPRHVPSAVSAVEAGGDAAAVREASGAAISSSTDMSRTQRDAYIHGLQPQQQHSPQTKQAAASSSSSGVSIHAYSAAAMKDQMQLAAHLQPQQQPEHQHSMSGTQHRSSTMGVHANHQHLQQHQQQQQQPHQQLAQHHSTQQLQMHMGGFMREKDSRSAGASLTTGVFKTPTSNGYPQPASSNSAMLTHQMSNGLHTVSAMHSQQQYLGYGVTKDFSPVRLDGPSLSDPNKYRNMTGGTSSTSGVPSPRNHGTANSMIAFRQGTGSSSNSDNASEAGRLVQQQQQQSGSLCQKQQMMLMQHHQHQQQQLLQKTQHQPIPQHPSHISSGNGVQQKTNSLPNHMSQTVHQVSSHTVPPSQIRTVMPRSPASASYGHHSSQAAVSALVSPSLGQVHTQTHPHHHLQQQSQQLQQQQQQQVSPHTQYRSEVTPADSLNRCATSGRASTSHPKQTVGSDSITQMNIDSGWQGSRQMLGVQAQPPAGSIRTGEPRVHVHQGSHGNSVRNLTENEFVSPLIYNITI